MISFEFLRDKSASKTWRRALALLAVPACLACTGCQAPIDVVHRISVDAHANPKDLRACVVEAIRGVDGVPGINPPSGGAEQALVTFRTTLPEVSGEVERAGDGVRVTIEVMARVEPANFWQFAQTRTQAISDAMAARCGAL